MLAYIDPGSGAIVLQVVIAGFLAAGMVLLSTFFGIGLHPLTFATAAR